MLGGLLAVVPAISSALVPPAVVGIFATITVLLGIRRGTSRFVHFGSFLLYAQLLVAGAAGVGILELLIGTLGAVTTWDSARNSITIRRQLLGNVRTRRVEIFHTGGTIVVVFIAGALSLFAPLFLSLSAPVVVVVALLVATLAFMATLTA